MSQPLFDTYVIVDWSARSQPSPAKPAADSIWWVVARRGGSVVVEQPEYARTRSDAIDRLAALLLAESAEGRRVLMGFDFPFGYPRGTAMVVTGQASARALWDWLAAQIEDGADNANNRFAVASDINAMFPGTGPFWGRPATWDFPLIPTKGRAREGTHPPERRHVEARFPSTQPVWKLYTTGSVGSQVLLGVTAVRRLAEMTGSVVWPFDTGLNPPEAPLVLAEIYPSLLARQVAEAQGDDEITDAAQVRVNAGAFARLDMIGGLRPLFRAAVLTAEEKREVEDEEAWILGVGHENALREAA